MAMALATYKADPRRDFASSGLAPLLVSVCLWLSYQLMPFSRVGWLRPYDPLELTADGILYDEVHLKKGYPVERYARCPPPRACPPDVLALASPPSPPFSPSSPPFRRCRHFAVVAVVAVVAALAILAALAATARCRRCHGAATLAGSEATHSSPLSMHHSGPAVGRYRGLAATRSDEAEEEIEERGLQGLALGAKMTALGRFAGRGMKSGFASADEADPTAVGLTERVADSLLDNLVTRRFAMAYGAVFRGKANGDALQRSASGSTKGLWHAAAVGMTPPASRRAHGPDGATLDA